MEVQDHLRFIDFISERDTYAHFLFVHSFHKSNVCIFEIWSQDQIQDGFCATFYKWGPWNVQGETLQDSSITCTKHFFISFILVILLIYKAFLSTQKMVVWVKPFMFVNRSNCIIRFFLFFIAIVSSVTSVLISLLVMQKVQCVYFLFRIAENMAACKQWHLSVSRQTGSAARSVFNIMLSEYLYLSVLI